MDTPHTDATLRPRRRDSHFARLLAKPQRYRFDAAVRILANAGGTNELVYAVRFRALLGAAYPGAEVSALHEAPGMPPMLTTPVMGLTGPTGVLPAHYTDILHGSVRNRSTALQDFLELLSQRLIGQFAMAGAKYRLHRAAETAQLGRLARVDATEDGQKDNITRALMAFIGYGTPHLTSRLAAGSYPLLHYAGLLSMRPRSADRLQAMLSDWLGRRVEVVQFVGDWLNVPPDQRSRLPLGKRAGMFNRLGVDAMIGTRAWDQQAKVSLRIGPLSQDGFAALLPDRQLLRELVSLTRAYLGFETGFAVNLLLKADAIPSLRLGDGRPPARLGWNTWLPTTRPRGYAADAVFSAELVEGEAEPERQTAL